MDLERGEERLSSHFQNERGARLIRASVSVIGKVEGATIPDGSTERNKTTKWKQSSRGSKTAHPSADVDRRGLRERRPESLSDISRVLRSKNAGPYEITMDVMFESKSVFDAVKASSLLSDEHVADALGISPEDIVWSGFFETALAFKVTIPRFRGGKKASAGGFMESDIHGSQQHLGLSIMKLPPGLLL
jgi:hypothetical protein